MLHIGLDDTDSVKGGCTTWLATEIIKELSEFDLIGNPRLVRLILTCLGKQEAMEQFHSFLEKA